MQTLVFPEEVEYEKKNDAYRTRRTNSVFKLINFFSEEFKENKNGTNQQFSDLSRLVDQRSEISNFINKDLASISGFIE